MITVKLLDSLPDIERKVYAAIASQVNTTISRNLSSISNRIKQVAKGWILEQPEIQSLGSGGINSLAGQFGIPEGGATSVIQSIAISVENSISIKFIPYNNNLRGGFEINIQPSTFDNLLSLPQGHVLYENGDLHWLEWLLKQGDRIIVANYQYNPESGLGRSGLGNMVTGGIFRVPPEFSGTEKDNFITRALIGPSQEKEISKIIEDALNG